MMNSNAELRLDPESQTLVAQPQVRPSLKDLAKIKHIFGPSVYIKAFFVPRGMTVVTKAFLEDHVTILAQGTVVVEDPDGVKTKYIAPTNVNLVITLSTYFDVCSPGLIPGIYAPDFFKLSAVSFGLNTNAV